jgi:4-hydroxybenzoate polyprenyltransferase
MGVVGEPRSRRAALNLGWFSRGEAVVVVAVVVAAAIAVAVFMPC